MIEKKITKKKKDFTYQKQLYIFFKFNCYYHIKPLLPESYINGYDYNIDCT